MTFAVGVWEFAMILLLTFAVFLVITGAFTAYFGSGKSRKIGAGLLVGGLVIGLLLILLRFLGFFGPAEGGWFTTVIVQTLLVLVAAIVGAAAAIGLFLLAIMKS